MRSAPPVIPAQAGIQLALRKELGPRFRGDDRIEIMATCPRIRIDRLLVERGLFESRAKAQAAIAAGLVTADGVTVAQAIRRSRGRCRAAAPSRRILTSRAAA